MYKIVFKSRSLTEEYTSTDFGEITDKVLDLKMRHHLWFVRGMYEEREDGTVFFDVDLCDKRSELLVSKNDQPLDTRGSQFLCVNYLLCSVG